MQDQTYLVVGSQFMIMRLKTSPSIISGVVLLHTLQSDICGSYVPNLALFFDMC